MLEAEGKDGHAMFGTASGRAKWLPEMDGMLRFLKLPTWTRTDVNALMQKLGANERSRGFIERYISAPSEKALAREKGGSYLSQSSGWSTLDLASQRVLEFCQRTKPACELIMQNDNWLLP